jgi:hypothetical protein
LLRTRHRVVRVATLTIAGLIATAGIAFATTLVTRHWVDSTGAFHACVTDGGALRLIDPSQPTSAKIQHCTTAETPVTWNQQGPPPDLSNVYTKAQSDGLFARGNASVTSAYATLPVRSASDPIASSPLLTIPNVADVDFHDCLFNGGSVTESVRLTNRSSGQLLVIDSAVTPNNNPTLLSPGDTHDFVMDDQSLRTLRLISRDMSSSHFSTVFVSVLYGPNYGSQSCSAEAQAISQ